MLRRRQNAVSGRGLGKVASPPERNATTSSPSSPFARRQGSFPFWDIWRGGVNYPFLAAFLRCRESCRLAYLEGWTSRLHPQWAELQWAFRWASWTARNTGWFHPFELGNKYRDLWFEQVPDPSPVQLEKQDVIFSLLPVMLAAAFERWPEDAESDWATISPTAYVPWTYADGKECPLRVRLAAVHDEARSDTWLVETHVGRAIKTDRFAEEAHCNLRSLLGLYALQQITGQLPAGVVYELINRPINRWPEPNADLSWYAERSAKILAEKPDYLQRVRVRISAQEFERRIQYELAPLMNDVRLWAHGGNHYPNVRVDHDDRYGYHLTPMYDAIVRRDFSNMYRRPSVFPLYIS
jgi:hypothetical protein